MVCHTKSVFLNYAVLRLWIMVGYTEPEWIIVCNAVQIVVSHGELYCARGVKYGV
jgi:general stress protein CsbA